MNGSSILSPGSNKQKNDKEPFCSSFRPSLSIPPTHMTFSQNKVGPTLRPRKGLVVSYAEEDKGSRRSALNEHDEAEDKNDSTSESEVSDDEDEEGTQECTWMELHTLCCLACNPVDADKIEDGT